MLLQKKKKKRRTDFSKLFLFIYFYSIFLYTKQEMSQYYQVNRNMKGPANCQLHWGNNDEAKKKFENLFVRIIYHTSRD